MTVKIITDSTAYINQELQQELGIRVIPLSVHFSDESFVETEVDYDYFYGKIEKTGEIPTSSQPSAGDIYGVFKEIIEAGDEVLAILISSAMSGTYQTAMGVKDLLAREIPGARIEVLDSRTNCMALGVQVLAAARCGRAGGDMESAIRAAESIRERVNFYFVPETLEYLKKGGRIGTASALLGMILKIRPILTVDMKAGMTHLWGKARGTSAAVHRMLELLEADARRYGLQEIIVHHINAPERAEQLKGQLADKYRCPISIGTLGPVIGLHTGLGTIGVVYTTESAPTDRAPATGPID
ncbi:MAG: DegV family protein [Syntrophomonadaceae bacterium]